MTTTKLQQQIVTPDESPASRVIGAELVELRLIYLDVKIVEVVSNNVSNWNISTEQDPFQTLKLGRTYAIEVSYSNFPGHYHQQNSLPSDSKPQFRLICSTIQFDNEFIMDTSSKKFEFIVPQNGPTCDVVFTIYYREEIAQTPKIATSLKIELVGNYNLDDPKLIEATHIDTSLATQTAILHITADMNKIRMTGWSRRGEILQTAAIDWEIKKLAEFIERQEDPEVIRNTMRGFSRTKAGNLIKWVRQLLKEYGQNFCLIVADHTDFETPWEMLELDDDEYLGAKAVIVRWMKIHTFKGPRTLKPQDIQKQGRVLCYLDEDALGIQQTYLEREMLGSLSTERCKDLKEMRRQLRLLRAPHNIGLIYLGCHGYEGEAIGSREHIFDRLTYLNLEMIKEVTEPRPIVFVNACESARLKREGDYFRGLPEVFLARIASGYIGTLGQVDSTYASQVAQRLLQDAHIEPEGIRVAEVLRKLREEAVNQLLNCDLDELSEKERIRKETELIYAFMYVYYGDSQVRLRLNSSETTEALG